MQESPGKDFDAFLDEKGLMLDIFKRWPSSYDARIVGSDGELVEIGGDGLLQSCFENSLTEEGAIRKLIDKLNAKRAEMLAEGSTPVLVIRGRNRIEIPELRFREGMLEEAERV